MIWFLSFRTHLVNESDPKLIWSQRVLDVSMNISGQENRSPVAASLILPFPAELWSFLQAVIEVSLSHTFAAITSRAFLTRSPFSHTYGTPGRFTLMNTWCVEAVNSAYKIPPFLLPVSCGCCLSNEVTSCHVTPPPTCVDFSLNPLFYPSLIFLYFAPCFEHLDYWV